MPSSRARTAAGSSVARLNSAVVRLWAGRNGDQVTLAASGDAADAALDSLTALLTTDLEA
jgi:phosphotransferase system HPr-like phosphotransfer protein